MIPDDATPDLAGIRQKLIEVAARKMAQTFYSPAVTSAVRERAALVVDAVLERLEQIGWGEGPGYDPWLRHMNEGLRSAKQWPVYRFRVES